MKIKKAALAVGFAAIVLLPAAAGKPITHLFLLRLPANKEAPTFRYEYQLGRKNISFFRRPY